MQPLPGWTPSTVPSAPTVKEPAGSVASPQTEPLGVKKSSGVFDPGGESNQEQRISAQLEEIVLHAGGFNSQNLSQHFSEPALQLIASRRQRIVD